MPKALKQKFKSELRLYFIYTIYLSILFFAFTSYERILLGLTDSNLLPFGFCIVKALIMAKVIIIGEDMNLDKLFNNLPLAYTVLYKTFIFCLLMFILIILEHCIIGLIEGKNIHDIILNFYHKKLNVALAKIFIMFLVFIFFFSVLETSRALGGKKLFNLFFVSRNALNT